MTFHPPSSPIDQGIVVYGDSLAYKEPNAEGYFDLRWTNILSALLSAKYRKFISVENRGISGDTSTQIATRHAAVGPYWDEITIFEMGRNDVLVTGGALVRSNIQACIDRLSHDRYIVLSVLLDLGTAQQNPAHQNRIDINAHNAAAAAAWPDQYYDWNPWGVDPATRYDDPPLHWSYVGHEAVAAGMHDLIVSKGWLTSA